MGRRTLVLVLTALTAAVVAAVALANTNTAQVSACGIKKVSKKPSYFVGFGGGDSFTLTGDARCETMNRQVDAGIGFLRQTFSQTGDGSYKSNPSYYDDWVAEAARHKINILPIVFQALPRGAKPPKSNKSFAKFGASLVKRYGPKGTLWKTCGCPKRPMRVYQIWNEPNLKVYWQPRSNAKAYTNMLGIVRKAMHKAPGGSGIEVISAGLPDSKSSKPGVFKFIEQMYKAGAAKKMDGLAFHPYAHDARATLLKLSQVRKLMNKRGDKRARIYVTEVGWATAGPKSEFRLGESQTAKQITKLVPGLWNARKKLKLGGFQYYTWSDKSACSSCIANHWGYYAGLLKLNGTAKKTFSAFKKAVARLH